PSPDLGESALENLGSHDAPLRSAGDDCGGAAPAERAAPSIPPWVGIDAGARASCAPSRPLSRRPAADRWFPCHSPTLRPWIGAAGEAIRGGRRPTWRSLEPGPHTA